MDITLLGIPTAPIATATGETQGRELRPGEIFAAKVLERDGDQIFLLAGRNRLTARTAVPLTPGQELRLQVVARNDASITLKIIPTAASQPVPVEARALAELGLPDTEAGRAIAGAMLGQQLPLTREAVLTLLQTAANLGWPPEALPALVYCQAQGLPLTGETRRWLTAVLAGQWLPEELIVAVMNGEGEGPAEFSAWMERLTWPERAETMPELNGALRELTAWLRREMADGRGSMAELRGRLETLEKLNNGADNLPTGGWYFLPFLAPCGSERQPAVLAVRRFRSGKKGYEVQRLNLLLELPRLGRILARLALSQEALTCGLQVEQPKTKALVEAFSPQLEEGLRRCGASVRVLPCILGSLAWLPELWGGDGRKVRPALDLQV